jgi:hypothetical protein
MRKELYAIVPVRILEKSRSMTPDLSEGTCRDSTRIALSRESNKKAQKRELA